MAPVSQDVVSTNGRNHLQSVAAATTSTSVSASHRTPSVSASHRTSPPTRLTTNGRLIGATPVVSNSTRCLRGSSSSSSPPSSSSCGHQVSNNITSPNYLINCKHCLCCCTLLLLATPYLQRLTQRPAQSALFFVVLAWT